MAEDGQREPGSGGTAHRGRANQAGLIAVGEPTIEKGWSRR